MYLHGCLVRYGGMYILVSDMTVFIFERERERERNVLPSKGSKSPREVVIRLKFVYSDNLYRFCAWLTASFNISFTFLETYIKCTFNESIYQYT